MLPRELLLGLLCLLLLCHIEPMHASKFSSCHAHSIYPLLSLIPVVTFAPNAPLTPLSVHSSCIFSLSLLLFLSLLPSHSACPLFQPLSTSYFSLVPLSFSQPYSVLCHISCFTPNQTLSYPCPTPFFLLLIFSLSHSLPGFLSHSLPFLTTSTPSPIHSTCSSSRLTLYFILYPFPTVIIFQFNFLLFQAFSIPCWACPLSACTRAASGPAS